MRRIATASITARIDLGDDAGALEVGSEAQ
jgi:hypothetical protein